MIDRIRAWLRRGPSCSVRFCRRPPWDGADPEEPLCRPHFYEEHGALTTMLASWKHYDGFSKADSVKVALHTGPPPSAAAMSAGTHETGGVLDMVRSCRECGCTDQHACPGGCYWVEPDLCSRCGT